MAHISGDSRFFPNLSDIALSFELRLRALTANCPDHQKLQIYAEYSRAGKELVATEFFLKEQIVCARQLGQTLYFPHPVPQVILAHITAGYKEWLRRKYCLPNFVEVEPGDVVVDCGGYVGGFGLSVQTLASTLHVFEPEARNFQAAKLNLGMHENVRLNQAGLFNTTRNIWLNVSNSSVEHSVLKPDNGYTVEQSEVKVYALADYCRQHGIPQLDFLKLEAEGVEPEVIEGLQQLRPRKMAIDVSPEREGLSPSVHLTQLLSSWGYETRQRGHVLFARRQ